VYKEYRKYKKGGKVSRNTSKLYVLPRNAHSYKSVMSMLEGRESVLKKAPGGKWRKVFPVDMEERRVLIKSASSESLDLRFFRATNGGLLRSDSPQKPKLDAIAGVRKFALYVKGKMVRQHTAAL
jgi:hypothetical protein